MLPKRKRTDDKAVARVGVVARDPMAQKPLQDSLFEVKSVDQSLQGKGICSVSCTNENTFNTECTIISAACTCEKVISYLEVGCSIPELMNVALCVAVICCVSGKEGVKGIWRRYKVRVR